MVAADVETTSCFPYVRARLPLRTDLIRGASAFSDGAGHRQGEDASASVTMDVVLSERKRRRAGKARQTALYRTGEGWADRRSS